MSRRVHLAIRIEKPFLHFFFIVRLFHRCVQSLHRTLPAVQDVLCYQFQGFASLHIVSNLSPLLFHNFMLRYGSSSDDQKALEIGMSGLSLVSRVPGSGSRPPALSGSSVSSAPDDHHHHNRHHSFGSFSFPNSDSHQLQNNSLPASPSSHAAMGSFSHKYLPKPPGLTGAYIVRRFTMYAYSSILCLSPPCSSTPNRTCFGVI